MEIVSQDSAQKVFNNAMVTLDIGVSLEKHSLFSLSIEEDAPKLETIIAVFSKIQEAIYATGRYLSQSHPREGRLKEDVKKECTLIVKNISMSSPLVASISPPAIPRQTRFTADGLEMDDGLGEASVGLFIDVIDALEEKEQLAHDKMHKLVESDGHRIQILKKVRETIPPDTSIIVGTGKKRKYVLNEKRKASINNIVEIERREQNSVTKGLETLIGILGKADIVNDMAFNIGNIPCKFKDEDIPTIQKLFGRVVKVRAKTIMENQIVKCVEELLEIDEYSEEFFSVLSKDGITVQFSQPLPVNISYQEKRIWIEDRAKLRIIGIGKTWEEAMSNFSTDMISLVVGYVGEKDENLSPDAIELKERLKTMVPNWDKVLKHDLGLQGKEND